jgi:hypothetical protein
MIHHCFADTPDSYLKSALTGARMVGTLETIPGVANIHSATRLPNGSFELHYEGSTDVDWDNQKTDTADGQRLFVDDQYNVHPEGELVLCQGDNA